MDLSKEQYQCLKYLHKRKTQMLSIYGRNKKQSRLLKSEAMTYLVINGLVNGSTQRQVSFFDTFQINEKGIAVFESKRKSLIWERVKFYLPLLISIISLIVSIIALKK